MESIPSDYDLDLYNFLNDEFKITEMTYGFGQNPSVIKFLVGMDESFNMNSQSKKNILGKIYWLVVDKYPNLSEGQIRKTIRVFLNEQYN